MDNVRKPGEPTPGPGLNPGAEGAPAQPVPEGMPQATTQNTPRPQAATAPDPGWLAEVTAREPERWDPQGLTREEVAEVMLEGLARAYHVCAWADAREEKGLSFPPQTRIDRVAPETSEEAKEHARGIAKQITDLNQLSLPDLALKAVVADTGKACPAITETTAHELGWYMGMQSLGHGVSWTDDHAPFGLQLPNTEFYPDFTDEDLQMR